MQIYSECRIGFLDVEMIAVESTHLLSTMYFKSPSQAPAGKGSGLKAASHGKNLCSAGLCPVLPLPQSKIVKVICNLPEIACRYVTVLNVFQI